MSTNFSLFPDDDDPPVIERRPTLQVVDVVRDMLASGDLDALECWMEQSDDMTAALRRIQAEAESAITLRVIADQALRVRLVAWPFMVAFENPGQVPPAFDIGPSSEPFGKRIRELWSKVVSGDHSMVMPYRFAVHMHAVYGITPLRVSRLVQDTVKMLGQPERRVPSGLSELVKLEPYKASGPICAPVALLAAVFSPAGGPEPTFVQDIDAMSKASDLIAAKLSLRSGTPKVRSLPPATFYGAIERVVEEDFTFTSRCANQRGSSVSASFHYDCSPGHARVMSRNTAHMTSEGHHDVDNLAFDATWLDYFRMTGFLKRLADQQKRGGTPPTGLPPSKLN